MFKFNFSKPQSPEDSEYDDETTGLSWLPAQEIKVPPECLQKEYSIDDYKETIICGMTVRTLCSENIVFNLSDEDHKNIIKAESQHSDLLPATYEGGLKIWECSYDLVNYFTENPWAVSGKKVLDLGCGAGLVGIMLLHRSSIVHFQDYNVEVINLVTIPNVLLNLENRQTIQDRCEFYCGDWASFTKLSSTKYPEEEQKYDVIVTSETMYNLANYKKLYEVFKQRLKANGIGYIAGKVIYFGVGGNMKQFQALIKEDNLFDIEILWKSTEGVRREIVKLTRHTS